MFTAVVNNQHTDSAGIRGHSKMDFSKIPTDPLGILVFILVGVTSAVLFVPKWLRENKAESGMAKRLLEELERVRASEQIALERADEFAEQRNQLIIQFSDMKKDNALITYQLELMTQQNEQLIKQVTVLTEQNKAITEQNKAITEQYRDIATQNQQLTSRVEALTKTLGPRHD